MFTRLELAATLRLGHEEHALLRQAEELHELQGFVRALAGVDDELEERARLLGKPAQGIFPKAALRWLPARAQLRRHVPLVHARGEPGRRTNGAVGLDLDRQASARVWPERLCPLESAFVHLQEQALQHLLLNERLAAGDDHEARALIEQKRGQLGQ